jgi:D-serine deaminase-like pyridoxal phosphate-dependent protein
MSNFAWQGLLLGDNIAVRRGPMSLTMMEGRRQIIVVVVDSARSSSVAALFAMFHFPAKILLRQPYQTDRKPYSHGRQPRHYMLTHLRASYSP